MTAYITTEVKPGFYLSHSLLSVKMKHEHQHRKAILKISLSYINLNFCEISILIENIVQIAFKMKTFMNKLSKCNLVNFFKKS